MRPLAIITQTLGLPHLRSAPRKVLRSDADEGRGAAVYASISAAIDALMTVCLKAALSQLVEERQVLSLLALLVQEYTC